MNQQTDTSQICIREGLAGIEDTLQIMRLLVLRGRENPAVRERAAALVRGLPPYAYLAEADAIFRFVRDCIRYTGDIFDVETLQAPEYTLQIGIGDCDDKVILVCSLLQSINHPCKLVALGDQPGECGHVIAETKIGPHWLAMECCTPEGQEPWFIGDYPSGVRCRRTLII